jgi:hypothetical protein
VVLHSTPRHSLVVLHSTPRNKAVLHSTPGIKVGTCRSRILDK